MRFFGLFRDKKKGKSNREETYGEFAARLLADYSRNDCLGKAAVARDKARTAEGVKDYDAAWRFYHEQKEHYLQHASRSGFTEAQTQTLALDASVSQQLANILRIEGKHDDALVHVIYWVASSSRPTKTQQRKLVAYFNRCKFKGVSVADLNSAVEEFERSPDFIQIRNTVAGWRSCK